MRKRKSRINWIRFEDQKPTDPAYYLVRLPNVNGDMFTTVAFYSILDKEFKLGFTLWKRNWVYEWAYMPE